MVLDKDTEKKVRELQVLESHLQSFLGQKQNFQIELNETDNALAELKKSDDEVYKVISGIMLKSSKINIEKELKEKKKMLEMKVDSIEKQEEIIGEKANELRGEINKVVGGKK